MQGSPSSLLNSSASDTVLEGTPHAEACVGGQIGRVSLPVPAIHSPLLIAHLRGVIALIAVLILGVASLLALGSDPVAGYSATELENGHELVTWVMGGGYAAEAGIRSGDLVRRVASPPGSGAWAAIEVVDGHRTGQTLLLTRRWSHELDAILFTLGLVFLACGVGVYLKALDRAAALRFHLFACIAGAVLISVPAIGNGHPWALFLEWVGSKAGMATFVHFFLTVPVDRWQPLRRTLVLAPLPILAFYTYSAFVQPDLYAVVKPTGYSYMAVGLLVSAAATVWPFVTAAPESHRRLWPVLFAAAICAMIYVFGSLLPYVLFRQYLIPAEVAIASLALIPAGLAWAMLRQPVMGMTLGPWALVHTVFDSTADPIFIVGRDGRVLDASRAGLALLGVTKPSLAGEPFQRLIGELEAAEQESTGNTAPFTSRLFSGQSVREREITLRLHDGRVRRMSAVAVPVRNERGVVDMAVLTLHDVTARHELEVHKDEFIANISHDLRAPLTAIKYSLGAVIAYDPPGTPEPIRRLLINADAAASRMAAMIDDLLELARLQAGRVQLKLAPRDLREIATASARTVEPLVAAKGQRLILDLPGEPCLAMVDGLHLERALVNLLSNAHKHGREGGRIRLCLSQRDDNALIAVQDDGPGISEAEQARVFERFYRTAGARNGDSGGTGLGLPIARAIVELHGGKIWVESTPGAGATFWISVPSTPRQPPTEELLA